MPPTISMPLLECALMLSSARAPAERADTATEEQPQAPDRRPRSLGHNLSLPTLALAASGLFFRLLAFSGAIRAVDSDEAVAGLMARGLAHGDLHVFFWGQSYGGTLDTFLLAPFVD